MNKFLTISLLCMVPFQQSQAQIGKESTARRLCSVLSNGRFFVKAKGPGSDSITYMTDTGGGLIISESVLNQNNIKATEMEADGQKVTMVDFSAVCPDLMFPTPDVNGKKIIFVMKDFHPMGYPSQGMLGQQWFAGHTWKFDYSRGRLYVGGRLAGAAGDPHVVKLGFAEKEGQRMANFPRIQISIGDEVLDMLFDTGATVSLSDTARLQLRDTTARTRATSFIIQSIFDKWKKQHPEWRVIHNADKTLLKNGKAPDMIEVPAIKIAGHTVGPVWFTARRDQNFTEWMSQWTDQRIVGAVGGSAFKYFQITVDYPAAIAKFER